MASQCEKCQGTAVPAAQMRTFEYEGNTLRCLFLVSSCMTCGHRWQDDMYETVNWQHAERAREVATHGQETSYGMYARDTSGGQSEQIRTEVSQA